MSFIVGIDGPSGAGKGTITEDIAKKFNLVNIDTGATFRCVALEVLNKNIDIDNKEQVKEMLNNINIEIQNQDSKVKVFLNGEDVTDKIRTKEVTTMAATVSKINEVRSSLAGIQRKMAQGKDVIMEGRDICTVIFPTADVKIYLDASLEERAKRRHKQNKEKGISMTYDEVLESIKNRDKCDMEREVGALKVADGAMVIDSTNMSIKEVEDEISKLINKRKKEKKNEVRIYKIRKETPWKKVVRAVCKFLINLFYVIVFRIEKVDEKNLPMDEPIIICANHLNTWDAVAIVCCSKRKIRFIAKEDLFNNRFLNWIGHVFDIIPIKRGMRDVESMKRSIKALKNGEVLGIFPEGTRKGLEKGAKVQNGAAYMALKTKVRVVPVGIQGSFKPFSKVKMYYGKPLDFSNYDTKNPEKDALETATKEIMNNIIMLTKAGK